MRFAIASSNPMRPPDWRYRRALQLLNSHRPASLPRDDPWTRRLLGELRSRRRGPGSPPHTSSNCHDSAIATALEFRAGGDALRPVVEAHLLAAARPADIAQRTGLPVAAIEAYHACFFDVADRLTRPDYIVRQVILNCGSSSTAARPAEAALKLAAYLGGPRVLEEILTAPHPQAEKLADLVPSLDETNDGLIALYRRLALLERTGISGEMAREALLHRIRRQATLDRDENRTEYERSMKAILDSMQFTMRQKEDVEKCPPELRPYFHGAVEMRADELMNYRLTGVLPPIENYMIELPQPPAREAGAAGGGAGDA